MFVAATLAFNSQAYAAQVDQTLTVRERATAALGNTALQGARSAAQLTQRLLAFLRR